MPPVKQPFIVARNFVPEIVAVKMSGLILVVDQGGTCNVLVSKATFSSRDKALLYAAILEKQLANQITSED